MDKHRVRGHFRNGKWIGAYLRRNRGGGAGDPGPANAGGGAVVVAILALGGTAIALGVTGINSLKSNTASRSKSSNRALSVEAQAGFKRTEAALIAHGFKAKLVPEFNTNCVKHSYGQVHKFFQSHPCRSLVRAYIQIGEPDQGLILVAISWVAMPDGSSAKAYKSLVDMPGAGNVTELSREVKPYKNIKFDGSAHESGVHGADVWNVQVKPVFPTTTDVISKVLLDSWQ
jgi:hypothetical protein